MTRKRPPYREEAVRAHLQSTQIFGDVILPGLPHHRFYMWFGLAVGTAVLLFLAFGQYSRRVTVTGQLQPEHGMVKLYPLSAGIVQAVEVKEGQAVAAGAVLFRIANPKFGGGGHDVNPGLTGTLDAQRDSLDGELRSMAAMHGHERDTLAARIAGLETSRANLEDQQRITAERRRLADDAVERYEALAATGFVSAEQARQKKDAALELSLQHAMLSKQLRELDSELRERRAERAALPLRQANLQAELSRSRQQVERQLLDAQSQNESSVTAPFSGTVTALTARPGSLANYGQALGALLPRDARLEVNLYVPSRGIGLVAAGNPVNMRYRAFPYQKYGQAVGRIVDVSAASLRPEEFDNGVPASVLSDAGDEPVYRVRVAIERQYVETQGRRVPLRAGMLVDADILLERKTVFAWLFDPIGKISSGLNL